MAVGVPAGVFFQVRAGEEIFTSMEGRCDHGYVISLGNIASFGVIPSWIEQYGFRSTAVRFDTGIPKGTSVQKVCRTGGADARSGGAALPKGVDVGEAVDVIVELVSLSFSSILIRPWRIRRTRNQARRWLL